MRIFIANQIAAFTAMLVILLAVIFAAVHGLY